MFFAYHIGPTKCQNFDVNFKQFPNKENRCFSLNYVKRLLANGNLVDRDWIVYSPSQHAVFCFVCRLFGSGINRAKEYALVGFNDWKNASRGFSTHEKSKQHLLNDLAYRTRSKQVNAAVSLDSSFTTQTEIEMEYWRKVLQRVVSVVKFLGRRGLPFRGSNQTIGSNQNGNFLGILELLSEYDPFLQSHISNYGNKGKGIVSESASALNEGAIQNLFSVILGRASYLSANICDEFVQIIGQKIFDAIMAEIKKAKYYSISVDSTPDVSHTDQLVFCVRYVRSATAVPVERFLQFIPITAHTGDYLSDIVLNFIEKHEINLKDCRGQAYDNASNMSGQYNGLQSRILATNSLATFIPCAAHSLNLVGSNVVSTNPKACEFFSFVENLYLYFVHSTFRWNMLKTAFNDKEDILLKRATGTRWSAKYDAIKSLHLNLLKVKEVLISLQEEQCLQCDDSKCKARGLLNKLCKFENVLLLKVWHDILSKFNKVNQNLQKMDLDLSLTVKLYNSLDLYIDGLRDDFDGIFDETKLWYENNMVAVMPFSVYQSRSTAVILTKDDFFRSVFVPIIDGLKVQIFERSQIYNHLYENFAFLTNLNVMSTENIVSSCQAVASIYNADVDVDELISECEIAKQFFFLEPSVCHSHASMYASIINDKLMTTFPNIEILLRIYLCMFVTNVTDERSFSKLKYIKNYLRNSMTNEKLNYLSLLSIEHEMLDKISFDDIIENFVTLKCRKKNISTTN